MNLFWKKMFGSLQSTAKFEEKMNELAREYQRFIAVGSSKEFAEYTELYKIVKSAEFKEKKRTLIQRKYSDTEEYRDVTKLEKLSKNKDVKGYYMVADSKELKDYLAFVDSGNRVQLDDPEKVKNSPELKKFKDFETSKEYKLYIRLHNSYILKEYEELKEKVSKPQFIESNKFWSNAKRWETVEEYQQEKRFNTLAQNPDIQFYIKQKPEKYDVVSKYKMSFHDCFDWNTLNASAWNSGFYKEKPLFGNYSYINERQANNKGNNVAVVNGYLRISTREEKAQAIAWHPQKGFVQCDYDFTSDVINGKNAICQKGGVFSAKMRFTGNKSVRHAFWLVGEKQTPHINICHAVDGQIEVGIYWNSKFETKYTSTRVKGTNPGDFFIYSLEWNEKELIWYINNMEIFRTSDFVPECDLFPMLNSFVPENAKGGNAELEVDYIKVFTKK